MTRISKLCLVALAASSLSSAYAGDAADLRGELQRQFGTQFVPDVPDAQTIQQPCAPCAPAVSPTPAPLTQSELRDRYERYQRDHLKSVLPTADATTSPSPMPMGSLQSAAPADTETFGQPAPQVSSGFVIEEPVATYRVPQATTPPPSRSGAHIAPYDQTPATPQLKHSSPTLSLLPNVGSKQSTGRQVWQVIDGDEDFRQASSSPYAPTTHHHGVPVSVRVSPVSHQPHNTGRHGGSSEGYVDDLPVGIVRPSIYPPADAFGNPSLDVMLAASIPANAITAAKIDPDRLMQTPVAYHTEGASLAEILRSLVPASYKVSYDVEPGVRDKVYRVTIEKPLAEALQAVESMANVHIKPYHKLQVLLVTEHRDALK